jgi:hypothetical protein
LLPTPAEKLQNFFGVFLQFHIGVDTACDKALELELAPAEALEGDTITRGDMALLICRAQDFMAWLQTL